jgi:group I intron endonuclease
MSHYYTPSQLAQCGVYAIENVVTGADYVGSTMQSFQRRWQHHRLLLQRNNHHNARLQYDWNFYGAEKFEFSIIEVVTDRPMAIRREAHWIHIREKYCKAADNYNQHAAQWKDLTSDNDLIEVAKLVITGHVGQTKAIRQYFKVSPSSTNPRYREARARLLNAMNLLREQGYA